LHAGSDCQDGRSQHKEQEDEDRNRTVCLGCLQMRRFFSEKIPGDQPKPGPVDHQDFRHLMYADIMCAGAGVPDVRLQVLDKVSLVGMDAVENWDEG